MRLLQWTWDGLHWSTTYLWSDPDSAFGGACLLLLWKKARAGGVKINCHFENKRNSGSQLQPIPGMWTLHSSNWILHRNIVTVYLCVTCPHGLPNDGSLVCPKNLSEPGPIIGCRRPGIFVQNFLHNWDPQVRSAPHIYHQKKKGSGVGQTNLPTDPISDCRNLHWIF